MYCLQNLEVPVLQEGRGMTWGVRTRWSVRGRYRESHLITENFGEKRWVQPSRASSLKYSRKALELGRLGGLVG